MVEGRETEESVYLEGSFKVNIDLISKLFDGRKCNWVTSGKLKRVRKDNMCVVDESCVLQGFDEG
jgi:hypothetical protein